MRLRALLFLLALTAGDYALWNWSIAGGHDIVSLVAGLTLLPLAVVSFGGLMVMLGRVLTLLLNGASAPTSSKKVNAYERTPHQDASEPQSSSSRLAA